MSTQEQKNRPITNDECAERAIAALNNGDYKEAEKWKKMIDANNAFAAKARKRMHEIRENNLRVMYKNSYKIRP